MNTDHGSTRGLDRVSLRSRVTILCFWLAVAGCDFVDDAPGHRYVLPKGFRGFFELRLDVQKGTIPPLIDGEYRFEFPASGVFLVADERCMKQWKYVVAEFAYGREIPVDWKVAPTDLALYPFLSQGGSPDSYFYLVGTEDDKFKAYTLDWRFAAGPLPAAPTYCKISGGGGPDRYVKNGRRHGIEILFDNGVCVRQEQWLKDKLVALRTSPPWFTDEEIERSRK